MSHFLNSLLAQDRDKGAKHRARRATYSYGLVRHEEYRVCECGERNPINATRCSRCSRPFKIRRDKPADLSVRGWISMTGLAIGSMGLVILVTTPLVWSVSRPGLLFRVIRVLFTWVSPSVTYSSGVFIFLSALGFFGISLIYLERIGILGGMACITVSLFSIYIHLVGTDISIIPLALIGVCGLSQFVQKARGEFNRITKPWGIDVGGQTG